MSYFYKKYKEKQYFCGHNVLTEGATVNQLSGNVGASVCGNVWVMTKMLFHKQYH
jgi:hypothetical protein